MPDPLTLLVTLAVGFAATFAFVTTGGVGMVTIPALMAMANSHPALAKTAIAGLALYMVVYLFMNLGAFAAVAFLRNAMRSEEIADYSGLVRRSPGMAICLAVILLSLLGMPPLVGLWAKVAIFAAMINATDIEPALWMLIGVAGLNAVLSLFYYVRVVKVMMLDPPLDESAEEGVPMFSLPGVYVLAVTLPVLLLGVWWDGLNKWAQAAASQLL